MSSRGRIIALGYHQDERTPRLFGPFASAQSFETYRALSREAYRLTSDGLSGARHEMSYVTVTDESVVDSRQSIVSSREDPTPIAVFALPRNGSAPYALGTFRSIGALEYELDLIAALGRGRRRGLALTFRDSVADADYLTLPFEPCVDFSALQETERRILVWALGCRQGTEL